MTLPHRSDHLSPTDVEAWLEGKLSLAASTHVGRCDDCRALLIAEGSVVESLQRLPRFAPSAGFADRVMAEVAIPALRRAANSRTVRAGGWLVAASLIVTLGGSLVWSLANQAALTDASRWALGAGWDAARAMADQLLALLTRLPAVREVQAAVGTPLRLAGVATAMLVLYGTGIMALRRLLALPANGAAHAGL